MEERYIDARIDATRPEILSEVRVDFARLEALIQAQPGRGWFIGAVAAVVALMVSLMGFGLSEFGAGAATSELIRKEMESRDVDVAERMDQMSVRMNQTNLRIDQMNSQIEKNTERLGSIEHLLREVIARQAGGDRPEGRNTGDAG